MGKFNAQTAPRLTRDAADVLVAERAMLDPETVIVRPVQFRPPEYRAWLLGTARLVGLRPAC